MIFPSYEKYKSFRNHMDVSNSKVSTDTKIPRSCFTDWKMGRYFPGVDKIVRLARYFGTSIENLLDEADKAVDPWL